MKLKFVLFLFFGISVNLFAQQSTPTLSSPANAAIIYVGSTAEFSWTPVTGATSYDVEFDAGLGISTIKNVTETSLVWLQGSSQIGPHTWHVRAKTGSIVGTWSNSRTYTVVGIPSIPTTVSPGTGSNIYFEASTTFSWNSVPNATSYKLQFDSETPVIVAGTTYTRSFNVLGNHTWKVLSSNDAGDSDWSTSKTFTVSLNTPSLTAPAYGSAFYIGATINFTWTQVSGATSYDIEFDAGLGIASLKNVTGTSMNWTIGSSNIGPHSWHVRAKSGTTTSQWSSSRTFSVSGLPLTPVLNYPSTASIIYFDSPTGFSWNQVSNATSYKIQFDNEPPTVITSTNYTRTFNAFGNHTWRVLASNPAGDSEWSSSRTFSVALATPSMAYPNNGTILYIGSSVNLSWTSVAGATAYDVELDTGLGYASITSVTGISMPWMIGTAEIGQHTWRVRAKNNTLTSAWSGTRTLAVAGLPAVPTLINPSIEASVFYDLSTSFSWIPVPNATGYQIQFDSETPIAVSGNSYARTFNVLGTHTWKVMASNPAGSSDWSVARSFNVTLDAPSLTSPANSANYYVGSNINFSWTPVINATSYDIEFDAGLGYVSLTNVTGLSLTWVLDALKAGPHTWHVRAKNGLTAGPWSSTRSFTVIGVPTVPSLLTPSNNAILLYDIPINFTWSAVAYASTYQLQFDEEDPIVLSGNSYSRSFNTTGSHTWKVQASNPAGDSEFTQSRTFSISIGVPSLTAPSDNTTLLSSVLSTFSWTQVPGATSYDVEFDAGQSTSSTVSVTGNTMQWQPVPPVSGIHTWHVRARNGSTVGSWSSSRNFNILGAPNAPTLIAPEDNGTTNYNVPVGFSWNSVPTATSYKIQFDTESPVSVTGTSYSRTFTTPGNHTWKVLASNAAGSSDFSVIRTITVALGVPNLLTPADNVTQYVGSSVNFSWSAVAGATSYDFEMDQGTNNTTLTNVPTANTTWQPAVANIGSHTWHVRARNGSSFGPWSTTRVLSIVGIPEIPIPALPENGATINYGVSTSFTWGAVTNASSYKIQFDGDTPITVSGTTYSRSFTSLGNHTWKILAVNAAGSSEWSSTKSFTVVLGTPSLISPENLSSKIVGATIILTWSAVPGASAYDLEFDAITGQTNTVSANGTSYSWLLGQSNIGAHNWRVRAKNGTSTGPWTSSNTFLVVSLPSIPTTVSPANESTVFSDISTSFTWNPVLNATGYQIQFDSEAPIVVQGTSYTRSFTNLGSHSWKVLASNAAGYSDWSPPKSFNVSLGTPVLSSPDDNTTHFTGTSVTFSWNLVSGAASYDVEFDSGSGQVSLTNITGNTLMWQLTSANVGLHNWHVRARSGASSGSWSALRTFSVAVPIVPETKQLLITPDQQWDFGNVSVNNGNEKIFVIQNKGNATLGVTGLSLSGTNADQFSISKPAVSKLEIPAGGTQEITVIFKPTSAGWKNATLVILNNSDNGSPSKLVTLNGTGVLITTKTLEVTPDGILDYGTVSVNNNNDKTITLRNTGNSTISVTGLSVNGTNPDQFMLLNSTGTKFDIPAGASQQLTVRFTPTSQGGKSAGLVITNNSDNVAPSKTLTLNGAGVLVTTKTLEVLPKEVVDFGTETVNNINDQTITLKNTGTATLNVSGLALTGTNSDQFSIISPKVTALEIPAGGTQQLNIRFKPTTSGWKTANLVVTNNSDNSSPSKIITLNATGVTVGSRTLVIAPDPVVEYGSVTLNNSYEKVITVRNTGTATATLTGLSLTGAQSDQFSITSPLSPTVDINGGSTQQITIRFKPTSTGWKSAALVFGNNSDNLAPSKIITLNGAGTNLATRSLVVTPNDFIDFGTVSVNNTNEKTILLQNMGSAVLSISSLTIGGPNADQFLITNPSGQNLELQAGTQQQITVRFSPTSSGWKSSILSIVNNSDNSPVKLITLNGTGYSTQVVNTPTVTTNPVVSVTSNSAWSGGNVISDGGADVTSNGLCWSTEVNPTISNSKMVIGSGIGIFSGNILGLTPGTTYHVRAFANNSAGTGYGADITFVTPVLATVLTLPVTIASATSANGGGEVTSDGGAPVVTKGLCWGTSYNPTISDSKTTNGSGIGSYTTLINGLSQGTTYHIRAYATNSIGTSYGTDLVFVTPTLPIVLTSQITSANSSSANGGGTVVSDGGSPILSAGLCWSTVLNPTLADFKTLSTISGGSFSSNISGLTSGTTYHVRAYASNIAGTSFGSDVVFTTTTLPIVTTSSITPTSASSIIIGGNVTSDGGAVVIAKGVCWGTSLNPTIADLKTTNGTGIGSYSSNISGLSIAKTYHFRAYATNSVGTTYGADVVYSTPSLPVVTTSAITSISATSANGGGAIVSDGGSTITASGLCWGLTANPTITEAKSTSGSGPGSFTASLSGLTVGTTYHVRAYATNSVGTSYGADIVFSTPTLPTVSTSSAMATSATTAQFGGEVVNDGGAPVTTKGVCWSSSAKPTISDSKVLNGTGIGSFSSSISGLVTGKTYHIRAFATNSVGTTYGDDVVFTIAVNGGVYNISMFYHIYPNPTEGRITIRCPEDIETDVNIYSIQGALLSNFKLYKQENNLDLQLAKGVYTVVLSSKKASGSYKLIIL